MLKRRASLNSWFSRWLVVFVVVGAGLVTVTAEVSPVGAAASVRGWKQDIVTVTGARGLSASMVTKVSMIAAQDKVLSTVVHQGTVDGISVRSGSRVVQSYESGHFVPLSLKAMLAADARNYLGEEIADSLDAGEVVLSATSAKLRRAKLADVITVKGWNGQDLPLRVTRIVEDRQALDSELLVSVETARSLGVDRPQSVILWRLPKRRAAFVNSLRKAAGTSGQVVDSWRPSTIDETISQARTKALAGEFSIERVKGEVVIDNEWKQTHLTTIAIPTLGNLACNKRMTAAVVRSFKQVSEAGLSTKIDFPDTKRLGGCFNAREIRTASGTSGRNLSRHSWAIAIDVNPTANAYGAVPTLDRCVVEIFRANGFAWGGTFMVPDGMHFEYTGQPKQTQTPKCAEDSQG